jgi:hypothetical protein
VHSHRGNKKEKPKSLMQFGDKISRVQLQSPPRPSGQGDLPESKPDAQE